MKKLIAFFRRETVLSIAGFLAVISCFIIPPSAEYADYINFRVLTLLFCLMTVVAGMKESGAFDAVSRRLIAKVHTLRGIALILVMLCFFLSMFLTNDVALVTMVPFTMLVFSELENTERPLLFTLIFETIAANLGSMLTPFGNPQNLYLFSEYGFGMGEFVSLMMPFTLISLLLVLIGTCFFCTDSGKSKASEAIASSSGLNSASSTAHSSDSELALSSDPELAHSSDPKLAHSSDPELAHSSDPELAHSTAHSASFSASGRERIYIKKKAFAFYAFLFLLALLSVARVLDYRILLAITLILVAIWDRSILKRVDYTLLITFVFFFVFIGNAGNIEAARNFLSSIMTGRETLTAVLASQVVSNVPAAILLSGFTSDGRALVIGTNLGGLGTLIASMASLITYKLYAAEHSRKRAEYLLHFTWLNLVFLAILYGVYLMIYW